MRWKDNRIKEEMEEEIVCKLWTQEPGAYLMDNKPGVNLIFPQDLDYHSLAYSKRRD